jgi:magnesium transporter
MRDCVPDMHQANDPESFEFFGISFDPEARTSRRFQYEDLVREAQDPSVFCWIDVQADEISVLNELLRLWDIDLALIGHFDEPEVLPRIVERTDCVAFNLYQVIDPEEHLDTTRTIEEIEFARTLLVLGADFVISFHRRSMAVVDDVRATCTESFKLAGKTPCFILFLFMERCLYDYAHLNLANDNFLDVIQERVFDGHQEELAFGIAVAGRNILTLKKLTSSAQIVLMLLATKQNPFISSEARSFFREMLNNAGSVREAIDSSRDLLHGVLANIQASAANRTSDVARVLTVLSGVLLPLTVITGLYGMNFENMPELGWRYGYFTVLGTLGVVAGGLLLLFRHFGWLRGVSSLSRPPQTSSVLGAHGSSSKKPSRRLPDSWKNGGPAA